MNQKYVKFIGCSLCLMVVFSRSTVAQDARVSQYQATPLLVNPAQTGDFYGPIRLTGLYSRVTDDRIFNRIFNVSADWKLDKQDRWAIGINYMRTGSAEMAINGDYAGISIGRKFFLDKYKLQELRIGAQASYLHGSVDESRPYNRLLDVGALRYWQPAISTGDYKGSTGYANMSVGLKYKITLDRLKIETGFSAYNITNPDFNVMYDGVLLKRYRVNSLSSIYYQADPKNAFKVEHFSWKEGIYLRDYKPARDTLNVHETTYSLTWYRFMPKKTLSVGLYSRSWEAVYGMLGLNFNERMGINVSYEVPIYKKYYNVSHFELSLSLFPFAKKKPVPTNETLTAQVTALMPFNVSFCLPCITPKPVEIVKTGPVIPPIVKPEEPVRDVPLALVKVYAPQFTNKGAKLLYADTIYYDFDKYNIRKDAALKLDKLIALLKSQKDLSLQVHSHTDLRGNYNYNERLSKNRFVSAKHYLEKAGIDSSRIKAGWYGKTQPINNCDTCNDVLQQKNRRSELLVSGFDMNVSDQVTFGSEQVSKEEYLRRMRVFMDLDIIIPSGNGSGYTIYIGAVKPGEDDRLLSLKGLNANVFVQKEANGIIRYCFGVFEGKENANVILAKLKMLGFSTAEVLQLVKQ